MSFRLRRLIFVVLCAFVLGTAGIAETRAQETATIGVTAFIGEEPVLTITVCDDSADFGSGLDGNGTIPSDADPSVDTSTPGGLPGEGIFYTWEPSCQFENDVTPGLTMTGNVAFHFNVCGTENDATDPSPDVTLFDQDLRFFTSPLPIFLPLAYDTWVTVGKLAPTCPTQSPDESPGDSAIILGLRVDDNDATGGFHSVLTFSVEPS